MDKLFYLEVRKKVKGALKICFIPLIALLSCREQHKPSQMEFLARAGEMYLYASDIRDLVPKGTNRHDSLAMVKSFVDKWVMEMVLLEKAKSNLPETGGKEEIEKQVQDYRHSLIKHAYEKELIRQKLDTVVKDEEIALYYESNKQDFELKNNIVKVLYIKLGLKSPSIDKVKRWYRSDDPRDRESLESYCRQHAVNFFLDDSIWLLFDDLRKEIPIGNYDEEMFLKNNRYVELQDTGAFYFVNIKGFRIKNSTSPLSFEKENIRSIIINRRKLELISRMRKDVFEDALKTGKFEIKIHEAEN